MPSLNALTEFKASFNRIAIAKDRDGEPIKLPYEDLKVPSVEPPPMDIEGAADQIIDSAPADNEGGFDMSAFLDSLPGQEEAASPLSALDDLIGDLGLSAGADTGSAADNLIDGMDLSGGSSGETSADTADSSLDDFLNSMDTGSAASDTGTPDASMDELLGGMDLGGMDMGGEPPAAEEPLPDSDASMDELLGGMDLGGMDMGGMDMGGMDMGGEPAQTSLRSEEPFPDSDASMDDLLGGMDLGGMDMGGEPAQTSLRSEEPLPDSDASMDDLLGGMDLGGSFSEEDSAEEETIEEPGIDMGGESLHSEMPETDDLPDDSLLDDELSDASLGDFDMGGEPEPAPDDGGEPAKAASDDFELGDLDNFDMGTAPDSDLLDELDLNGGSDGEPIADSSLGDFDNFDMGSETGTGADTPIDFNLGDDFASDTIDLGSEHGEAESADMGFGDFSGEDAGSGEFDLGDLDDIFGKSKSTEEEKPKQKRGRFGIFGRRKPKAADIPEAESDIEEIQLSQDDVDKLLATIASYPLNLRIACEELIAEQVILPQQLSRLIRYLVNGAHVRETAALVEEITGKPVVIPKSYEKMTGAAFEAEQASFAYIFVHNFLPVFRLFLIIAALIASVGYLGYQFIYTPVKAENLYKRGYEQIPDGNYQRANSLFNEAFTLNQKKKWFYEYAEAFREQRRYSLAEEKYDQLLGLTDNLVKVTRKGKEEPLKIYPRDKKGVLDYAFLNTYYLLNYEKANRLLQEQLLNYSPNDIDGLYAAGDNFLLWADSDPEKYYDRYEDARFSYARLMELKGWQEPIVERMLKYFIRTDNLQRVLELRHWFESSSKRNLSPSSKSELAGYLLDKQLEEVKGVPNPYLEGIDSVRAMLLEAVSESSPAIARDKVRDPNIPEPHYHLARYYKHLNNSYEERLALENAIRAFDLAKTETIQRRLYRVDTHYRYSDLLINAREFFKADEEIVKSIDLYKDFYDRRLLPAGPAFGKLYAAKGDIEYFVKSGDMGFALEQYYKAEENGYSPPEIQYRMGSAHYQLAGTAPAYEREGHSQKALEYLFKASKDMPLNRRMLYALGNAAYRRGDYFAAQGYYDRLIRILDNQKVTLPILLPNNNPEFLELGERLMMANNNLGVVYEALANQTGNREYRSRALTYYTESSLAWDSITRNPETMTRMRLVDTPGAPGINQAYLNAHNALRPNSGYTPQIFPRIDKDVEEPSRWEILLGGGSRGD